MLAPPVPPAMAFRSPHPDADIPDVALTDYVLGPIDEHRDRPALVDGLSGRTITFGALAEGIRQLAAGLSRRGIAKGDVVAIWSPNLPEYAIVFHAVSRMGAVPRDATSRSSPSTRSTACRPSPPSRSTPIRRR
jgi:acyl-CoA synthetase (AMP-forming)/AMP-acid ligase II